MYFELKLAQGNKVTDSNRNQLKNNWLLFVSSILFQALHRRLYLSSPKVFKKLYLCWLKCSDKGQTFLMQTNDSKNS